MYFAPPPPTLNPKSPTPARYVCFTCMSPGRNPGGAPAGEIRIGKSPQKRLTILKAKMSDTENNH